MIFGLTYAFFASQILAGIATISNILSFQFKERKHIILFFILSTSCIAVHYILLGRVAAAILLGLSTVRFLVAYKSTWKYWRYIFIGAFTIVTLILFKDLYDFILLLAASIITIATFQKTDFYLRIFMMGGTIVFIFYNGFIGSPIGVLLESIFLGSNVVGYYRHYIRKNKI